MQKFLEPIKKDRHFIVNHKSNLGYLYFQEYCKIIAVDLNKQAARDADSKVIQQINFTSNLD